VNLEFFIHIPMPATYSCGDVCRERAARFSQSDDFETKVPHQIAILTILQL